jgi:hypothetical protein
MDSNTSNDPQATPLNRLPQQGQNTNPVQQVQPPQQPDVVESILQNADQMNNNMPNMTPEQYMANMQEMSQYGFQSASSTDLWDEAKLPLFVAALVFLGQQHQLATMLARYLPKMFVKEGVLTTSGVVVKSLLLGVVFYLVLRFVF